MKVWIALRSVQYEGDDYIGVARSIDKAKEKCRQHYEIRYDNEYYSFDPSPEDINWYQLDNGVWRTPDMNCISGNYYLFEDDTL